MRHTFPLPSTSVGKGIVGITREEFLTPAAEEFVWKSKGVGQWERHTIDGYEWYADRIVIIIDELVANFLTINLGGTKKATYKTRADVPVEKVPGLIDWAATTAVSSG